MRVALGVPVLNNFKGFAELVHSLGGHQVEIIVADNWNDNLGVSKSWNKFMWETRSPDYDVLVICNDDVIFHPNAFAQLLDGWNNRPEDAAVVTAINGSVSYGYHKAPDYSCFALNPKWIIENIGWFDEEFSPAYFEDNDHHYRVRLAEYEAYSYSQARITHKGSQTQNANPNAPIVTSQMFEKNRAYYISKWGGNPGEEQYSTPFNDPSRTWKD